jgi:Ran GTPase-activating protein (RanGAP) involved in mRNA processing and transport
MWGLRRLLLAGNRLQEQGLLTLATPLVDGPSQLEELDLMHNSLGPLGAICLASILPRLTALQSLDISHNAFGAPGVHSVCCSLAALLHLRTVYIKNSALGGYGPHMEAELRESRRSVGSVAALMRLEID